MMNSRSAKSSPTVRVKQYPSEILPQRPLLGRLAAKTDVAVRADKIQRLITRAVEVVRFAVVIGVFTPNGLIQAGSDNLTRSPTWAHACSPSASDTSFGNSGGFWPISTTNRQRP